MTTLAAERALQQSARALVAVIDRCLLALPVPTEPSSRYAAKLVAEFGPSLWALFGGPESDVRDLAIAVFRRRADLSAQCGAEVEAVLAAGSAALKKAGVL